jgi:hypothetical protein
MRRNILDSAFNRAAVATLAAIGVLGSVQDGRRFDAGETATFTRQLESVKVQIVEALYPDLKLPDIVPLAGNIDEGADTFVWREFDHVGLAKMISSYATDLPEVDMFGKENKTSIESIGAAYSYSIQDVRRAAMANLPLEARKGVLAREMIERKMEHVGALGDATRNVPGLLNNPNVPLITAGITGTWSTAAATAVLDDLHILRLAPWKASKQIHTPNTLLLGTNAYGLITQKRISDLVPSETVYSTFLKSQDQIKRIIPWVELDTAGAGSVPRAVVGAIDSTNVEMVKPLAFESLPPQPENLRFKVPCHGRFGGVVIYRPFAFAYCDLLG